MTSVPAGGCDACGDGVLTNFADLGRVPAWCGTPGADQEAMLASPYGRMVLAYCGSCAYTRNAEFSPDLVRHGPVPDTDLHHSPAYRRAATGLAARLVSRYPIAGARVLEIGCGQGGFLRELCRQGSCRGVGYDPGYAGRSGPDPCGAELLPHPAPRGPGLPDFDLVVVRGGLGRVPDPYEFLVDLRERADGREVYGYIEVPDAGYDLTTAGWAVTYPRVSYFGAYALCRILRRAGWRVEATGTRLAGISRWVEVSANRTGSAASARLPEPTLPGLADRDRELAAIRRFHARHVAERDRWRQQIAGYVDGGLRPALWGAGARGIDFLGAVDTAGRISAVVDLNSRVAGRYLPTGHRVDPPEILARVRPGVVITTNPAYQDEVAKSLAELGISAQLTVA